ncbi:MAG: hypothetical protein ACI9U6_001990, partial [Loktanella salsilacus]
NFQSLNRPSRPLRRVCITASPVKGLLRLVTQGRKSILCKIRTASAKSSSPLREPLFSCMVDTSPRTLPLA